MVSCSYGLGRHQDMLQPKDRVNALLWQWIAQPIELTAMMLGRISICVMLIRLFPTKIWLARFLVTITALGVVFTVLPSAMIFSCRPVQAMWDESLDGWCPDPKIQVSFALTKAGESLYQPRTRVEDLALLQRLFAVRYVCINSLTLMQLSALSPILLLLYGRY